MGWILPISASARVTAGLMWHPEVGPIRCTRATITLKKPNAGTSMSSMCGELALNSIEDVPKNISTNVPKNSHKISLKRFI